MAAMAARGVGAKRRHVITSTRLSWKLLILFCGCLSCVVVLAALFRLHSSDANSYHLKVTRSSLSTTFQGPPKIAFLFLVRRNIPLDFLWDTFFQVS